MKRFVLAVVAAALIVGCATAAGATGLSASASCNQQWVNVTVQHDGAGWVMARKPGKDWFISGDRFVPDIGATNPASDYDIVLEVEQWDVPEAQHKVLASTSVRTPNCATVSVPVSATVLAPAVVVTTRPRQVVEPSLSWIPVLPEWLLRAVVEAVRGLP